LVSTLKKLEKRPKGIEVKRLLDTYKAPISLEEIAPTISIIIPTLNAERTLAVCLNSIRDQDYPRDKIEIIIVDGGSKDNTLKIAEPYVNKIIRNPLVIEEAGKPLAIDIAKNEIIAFIDSDNIIPSTKGIRRMIEPFNDPEIVGSEPLYYEYRRKDGLITRYCSLIGGDDAIYPYLGNYDRFCHFKGKWTEIPLIMMEDKGNYLKIELNKGVIPSMGANGFFVHKEALKKTRYKPLHIHTNTIHELVNSEYNCMAKVKIGVVHLHGENTSTYVKKKIRRIQKHFLWKKYYEYNPVERLSLLKFILFTLTLFPLARDVVRGYKKIPDHSWLFHFIACFLSLFAYGLGVLGYMSLSKVSLKKQSLNC
jgi:glycosyltransferase involved in cell wall biosynthesis